MDTLKERGIAVIGAASNVGIRPYDDSTQPRRLDTTAAVLRSLGVVKRLGADDLGDVPGPAYRDFERPPGGVRNEEEVGEYCRALATRVASAIEADRFTLVLGSDCSIVLGSLLGARRRGGRIGLAYLDGHADFATPQESVTGSAASMCLALAVGRGESPLARLAGPKPLVRAADVALIGRRDANQPYYGNTALVNSPILDVPGPVVISMPGDSIAKSVLARLARPELDGFWIHVDADVLDAEVMPAVDSPEPNGPDVNQLAALLAPLVHHPKALGMQITIYDPVLDPDRSCARRLITLLDKVFTRSAVPEQWSFEAGGVAP